MIADRMATYILAVLAGAAGVYASAYLLSGMRYDCGEGYSIERDYRYEWQLKVFQPAARIESWLTGRDVNVIRRAAWDLPLADPCA